MCRIVIDPDILCGKLLLPVLCCRGSNNSDVACLWDGFSDYSVVEVRRNRRP